MTDLGLSMWNLTSADAGNDDNDDDDDDVDDDVR